MVTGKLFLQLPYFLLQYSYALLIPISLFITRSFTLRPRLPSHSIKLFFLVLYAMMIEYKCQILISIINSAFFPLPRNATRGCRWCGAWALRICRTRGTSDN